MLVPPKFQEFWNLFFHVVLLSWDILLYDLESLFQCLDRCILAMADCRLFLVLTLLNVFEGVRQYTRLYTRLVRSLVYLL